MLRSDELARPRFALVLVPLALAARAVCCVLTVAPDRDTANYVSMARDFVAGDWRLALAEPFPPLHPLLLAIGSFWTEDNVVRWRVGQVLTIAFSCVALMWMVRAARETFGPMTAWIAGVWFALGMLPSWLCADAMSEPLFQLLAVGWILARLSGRPRLAAAFAGLSFVTRLEGSVLVVASVACALRERAWRPGLAVLTLALVPGAIYLGLRSVATGHFELLPKIRFMQPVSSFGATGAAAVAARYLRELAQFLGQGFDGLGYLALPGLLFGLLLLWRSDLHAQWARTTLLALAALLVVPTFFANRRFWTPWLPLLLPVAAFPFAQLLARRRALTVGLVALGLLPHAARLVRTRRASLAGDRAVGTDLAEALAVDAGIASDLPRLVFFAGRRALPARSITAHELMGQASLSETRAVVSLVKRAKLDVPRLRALGYHLATLSIPNRGLVLYRR